MPSSDTDERVDGLTSDSHSDEANTQTVAVETETVPSVPTLNVSTAREDSLKSKRSQDSIPRATIPRSANRKRNLRLAQGSKADIFAAKVANAVEEQESSDGEESFVYENSRPGLPHNNHSFELLRVPYNRTKSHNSLHHQLPESSFFEENSLADNPTSGSTITPNGNTTNGTNNGAGTTGKLSHSPTRNSVRNFVAPLPKSKSSRASNIGQPLDTPTTTPIDSIDQRDMQWPRLLHQSQRISRSRNFFNEAPQPVKAKEQNDSVRAKNKYLQKWRIPNAARRASNDLEATEDTKLLRSHPSFYHSTKSLGRRRPTTNGPNGLHGANEHGNDLNFNNNAEAFDYLDSDMSIKSMKLRFSFAICVFILLFIGFIIGLFVDAVRPLSNFEVLSLSDVLVSDRELVFSLIMHARNPSLFATYVENAELDIFATSSNIGLESTRAAKTILLGSVNELDAPVVFHGGFSSPMQWKSAAVKLKDPLASNLTMWTEITEHEFDITVKGSLIYSIYGKNYTNYVSRSYKVPTPRLEQLI